MEFCGTGSWGQDTGATNYPLRGSKGSLYEGGVRVPGVVHYPRKLKAGSTFDGIFSASDWFPTLLSAAGVPDVRQRDNFPFDGVDQWQHMTAPSGPSPNEERMLLLNVDFSNFGGALVQGRFKYFNGGPFYFEPWQYPPEVGAAEGWSEDEDPKVGLPIWCPWGCMVDLIADPREERPFTPNVFVHPELLPKFHAFQAAHAAFKAEAVTPLFWQTITNPKKAEIKATAEANGGVWTPFMD